MVLGLWFNSESHVSLHFPGGSSGKEPACPYRSCKRRRLNLGGEDALEKDMATHSSILAEIIP